MQVVHIAKNPGTWEERNREGSNMMGIMVLVHDNMHSATQL